MPFFWSTPIMILTVGGRFLQHSASPKPFSFPPQLCKDPKRICSVLRSCYRDWDHLTIVTEIGITWPLSQRLGSPDYCHRDWDYPSTVTETRIIQLLLQRLGSPDYCHSDWDYLSPVTETRITWPLSQRPSAYTSQHEQSQTFVNISLFSSFFLLLPNPNYVCQIQNGNTIYVYPTSDPVKRQLGFWEMQQQSFNDSKHEREPWISETMNTSAVPEAVEDTSWQTMRQTDK